jgi:hypothetical protein
MGRKIVCVLAVVGGATAWFGCGSSAGTSSDAGAGVDTGEALDGGRAGDAPMEMDAAGSGDSVAPQTDAATDGAKDGSSTDGGYTDGGACPASCNTDLDCNSCPLTPGFGGWSCSGGTCRFMG